MLVWIYPVRTTKSEEVIKKLEFQTEVFGNPVRVVSDRGAAFTSNAFKEYCERNRIQHVLTTTGIPRGNGQVERMNRIIIEVLSTQNVKHDKLNTNFYCAI